MDVYNQLPDNEYIQDSSADNIVSEYTNQIQQSIVIPVYPQEIIYYLIQIS